jgi:hypothetical protein
MPDAIARLPEVRKIRGLKTQSCMEHAMGALRYRDAEFGASFEGMQFAEGVYGTLAGAKEEHRGLFATSRLAPNSRSLWT